MGDLRRLLTLPAMACLLGACAATTSGTGAGNAAAAQVEDPYPSTYTALSRRADGDRNVTIYDGEGRQHRQWQCCFRTARWRRSAGPNAEVPAGYTRDRRHRQVRDARHHRYPQPSGRLSHARGAMRIATATKRPTRSRPRSGPNIRSGRRTRASARALANGGVTSVAGPARLGQPVRRARRDAEERLCAHASRA